MLDVFIPPTHQSTCVLTGTYKHEVSAQSFNINASRCCNWGILHGNKTLYSYRASRLVCESYCHSMITVRIANFRGEVNLLHERCSWQEREDFSSISYRCWEHLRRVSILVGVLWRACMCNFFSVCVNAESGVINDNELYFLGTARLMEEIGQRGYRADGHSSFISFVSFRVSSPLWARLLSYRETSLDTDSYRHEQKRFFFFFPFTICFGLHRWHQNKIASLSELPMQIQELVSVCVGHRLSDRDGLPTNQPNANRCQQQYARWVLS